MKALIGPQLQIGRSNGNSIPHFPGNHLLWVLLRIAAVKRFFQVLTFYFYGEIIKIILSFIYLCYPYLPLYVSDQHITWHVIFIAQLIYGYVVVSRLRKNKRRQRSIWKVDKEGAPRSRCCSTQNLPLSSTSLWSPASLTCPPPSHWVLLSNSWNQCLDLCMDE